ncbi:unnamed protein product [Alopecurus aequalis]
MEKERVEVRTQPRPPLPASQQRAVDEFWRRRQEEIEATVDFKGRMLPMARLKKVIIRAEEDGMMISADTPAFLSKLCELFVQELAVRAWACAESHNRHIILDSDIAEAVASTESYDFLAPLLLQHKQKVARRERTAPAKAPAKARLVTRKRHRPDPDPRGPVRRIPPITAPASPAGPSSVRCVPFPCVLREAELSPEDGRMLPEPSINYMTMGGVLFRNGNGSGNTFAGENSAAEMVTSPPLAGSAGELQPSVPPAAYYLCPYPVIDDSVEAFAVGNTEIPAGNADGYGGGALCIGDGGQQQKLSENVGAHRESLVVQQSSTVQEAPAGGLGGIGNEPPMYMLLEEILVDEKLLFPDADLLPPPDSEDFIVDQDVLDDVFANPSSSSSASSN